MEESMKKWFLSLNRNKQNILSALFSIGGIVFIIIGFLFYYLIIIGIICLFLGLIFAEWSKKENANNESKTDYIFDNNEYELSKYNELKNNNYDILNVKCNFECSLKIMGLKQIKENTNFKESDFDFNIDNQIGLLLEKGNQFFINSKCRNFVALDIETTGLDKEDDKIIQIAMVKVENGKIVDTYCTLVNPKMHISEDASEVNGIYDIDVRNEKTIDKLFPEIFDFIGNFTIVAHNAQFDMGFLRNEWNRCFENNFPKHRDICTMKLWKILYRHFQNENPTSSKLSTLVQNLLDDDSINDYNQNKHDALCDALATAKVFMRIYDDNYLKLLK